MDSGESSGGEQSQELDNQNALFLADAVVEESVHLFLGIKHCNEDFVSHAFCKHLGQAETHAHRRRILI